MAAAAGKKTSEQMNSERRAAKLKQKRGTGTKKPTEGFSLFEARKERNKRQNYINFINTQVEEMIAKALKSPVIVNSKDDSDGRKLRTMREAERRDRRLALSGYFPVLGHQQDGTVIRSTDRHYILGIRR